MKTIRNGYMFLKKKTKAIAIFGLMILDSVFKMLHKLFIVLLIVSVYICLTKLKSCRIEEIFRDYVVQIIDDYPEEDYFSSEELDFAKAGGVIVKPVIEGATAENPRIFFFIYSKTGTEKVMIRNVRVKNDKRVIFEKKSITEILYSKRTYKDKEILFEGNTYVGSFLLKYANESSENTFQMEIEIQVEDDNGVSIKTIPYDIKILGYLGWYY